ncbi:sucrose transport protein SUC2-like [Andrographis paniculata]|uniref:sucrose transport protein SUC2-like n=1 Tax=Andrographis paniculata TaxID=175694 RepID=UPI0021E746FD|nr:sucrose transport protein SUC2-like [Andrographis paniculata]
MDFLEAKHPQQLLQPQPEMQAQLQLQGRNIIRKLTLVAAIAAGVQFVWAVQLTHLTPMTQLLGLSHKAVSLIWLCGPITGLIVQPLVGHHSDRCTSSYGMRRPYLVAGTLLNLVSVSIIGFCSDIGTSLGDPADGFKPKTVELFVFGFWLLDISNNMIQGPCRALLADLSEDSGEMMTIGNALYAFFMAVGNTAGYAVGSLEQLHLMPGAVTPSCNHMCANLKVCILMSGIFTAFTVTVVALCIKEVPLEASYPDFCHQDSLNSIGKPPSVLMQIVIAARGTSNAVRTLYTITALSWIGIFPFMLYSTDWMGKEVFGGEPSGTAQQVAVYDRGVHAGSLGLMFSVLVMGAASLLLEPLALILGTLQRLWCAGNFILALCMGLTIVLSKMAYNVRIAAGGTLPDRPPMDVTVLCFLLMATFGVPQAILCSIPFALACIYSRDTGTGQGLTLGLLNLAIVVPQVGVTVISGPLDELFSNSNLPGFVLGGIAAVIGGIAALKLPNLHAPPAVSEPTKMTADAAATPGFL